LLRRKPLDAVARPAWNALIAAELRAHRALDALSPPPAGRLDDVTVLVKTFERPHIVRRLVESIRRLYPSLRVLVVDDSREPIRIAGVETLALPFDQGLSAGRNAGLAAIETPFFLLADDDFVFFRGTRLAPVLARMRTHPELDIVGGRVIDLPDHRCVDTRGRRALGARDDDPPPNGTIAGLERREVVRNFFVGRTERVRRVGWDPALKLVEHADFFGRARGVLTIAFDPTLAVLHAKTPFDEAYVRKREDVARYHALLAAKWRTSSSRTMRLP
jgi:glycosyltransferase involved in cell wall biosynthesis